MTGCQVIIDKDESCGAEIIQTYKCKISTVEGEIIENVGVCIIHKELMDRQYKHQKGEVFQN